MKDSRKLALYGHDSCGSAFITELRDDISLKYLGKCPNPHCNRPVALLPEEIFTTADKARREYIKKAKSDQASIFWHT